MELKLDCAYIATTKKKKKNDMNSQGDNVF